MHCDSVNYLSPHCTLRYDAGCRATHLYAHAVKVVLSDAPLLPASNDGAFSCFRYLSFPLSKTSIATSDFYNDKLKTH